MTTRRLGWKFHFKSLRRLKHGFLASLCLMIVCIFFHIPNTWPPNKKDLFTVSLFKNMIIERQLIEEHIRLHWHRDRQARVDWWSLLKPCYENTDWGQVKRGWEKHQRTDASVSFILSRDIRPAGQFSRLFIQSKTKDGQIKKIGGDSWRVYLRGPVSLAATIFDHNNGTYEALFLVMEPGKYRVETHLDFSLCDGFRDPPIDWFIKGSAHGRGQPEGTLGFLDDYMNEPIPGNLSINIPVPHLQVDIQSVVLLLNSSSCEEHCTFLIDGYGRWVNDYLWVPFVNTTCNTSNTASLEPNGVIVTYGDSLALRFGSSMAANPKVMRAYKKSTYRYNWVYPVKASESEEDKKVDDLDFDSDRVVSDIKETLDLPEVNTEHSTLVLNMGLHYVITINFTTYHFLIEKVLDLIFINPHSIESKDRPQFRYKTNIIWKTTTQIKKENAKWSNRTQHRFFTAQRVLLFNAYATWRMCKAGVPVLDVLPVTTSYRPGPSDVVHYPNSVFRQAENALADFKKCYTKGNQNNDVYTCIS